MESIVQETYPYRANSWSAVAMRPYDNAPAAQRAIARAVPSYNVNTSPRFASDVDRCYTDVVIPTRPRNRHRPLVRVLTS